MTEPFAEHARIAIAAPYRLQWEDVRQAYVLLYPEGVVTLNASAGEILKRCDGARTVNEIIADLKRSFPGAELESDVLNLLGVAREKGWVCAQ